MKIAPAAVFYRIYDHSILGSIKRFIKKWSYILEFMTADCEPADIEIIRSVLVDRKGKPLLQSPMIVDKTATSRCAVFHINPERADILLRHINKNYKDEESYTPYICQQLLLDENLDTNEKLYLLVELGIILGVSQATKTFLKKENMVCHT